LESSSTVSEVQLAKVRRNQLEAKSVWHIHNRLSYGLYALSFAISISLWFIAIRSPLWLDETGTYWMIKDGFSQIWSRQYFGPPVYFYIVWLAAKVIGTSEIALRIPSVLAMLGAAYLLYLIAREFFDREIAVIATIVFCIHPIVRYASIDARPYAFATLATNAAILTTLRMRNNSSNWLAALLGLTSACILYFHYLYAAILPALVICLFIVKADDLKAMWRQLGVATAVFGVACLPLIPGLHYMFSTSGSHVYEPAPQLMDLFWTLAPDWTLVVWLGVGFVALLGAAAWPKKRGPQEHVNQWSVLECVALAFVPLLILYGVSVATSIHMFPPRHRLVAVPGIALCWAFVVSRFRMPAMRLLFCAALVAAASYQIFSSPSDRDHGYTWKYALAAVEKNASPDNTPVLICSDFPESDSIAMPLDSAKVSRYFAQLSYYKLSVPVVPLPRSLNAEAIRVGSQFLQQATQKHERFLAVAFEHSSPTLDWLAAQSASAFSVRELGVYDRVKVLEFTPRTDSSTNHTGISRGASANIVQ